MAALSLAHPGSLSPNAQAALTALGERPWSEELYLAGSSALALYLGHRPVQDLDLMTATNRLTGPERRDLLAELIALDPSTRVETARDGYLYARQGAGTGFALRLFYYPYPRIDPGELFAGVEVAAPVDLGLMKLAAIISRGGKRDFVDLYLLCRRLPLADLLDVAEDKFGHVRDFPLQAFKGLADLSQIDGEPMPRLALPLEWSAVEDWLRGEVADLARARVGLGGDAK
jgi:hypothetical protein